MSDRKSNRTRRLIVGAFGAAAIAAPLYAAVVAVDAPQVSAAPACLATVRVQGQLDQCAGYSNGQPVWLGTPNYIGGNGPDAGLSTGPLLPGTTISRGVG